MKRLGGRALALLLIALGVLLAALWRAPGPFADARHWHAPEPRAPNLDAVRAAMLQRNDSAAAEYPEVLERPLFNSSRRQASSAPPSEAPPPPPPEPVLDGVTVTGIISGPLLSGIVMQDGGEARFLRVGEQIKDWTLVKLDGRQAVFQRADKEQVIDLEIAEGGGTPPSADSTTVVRAGDGDANGSKPAADAALPAVVHPSGAKRSGGAASSSSGSRR